MTKDERLWAIAARVRADNASDRPGYFSPVYEDGKNCPDYDIAALGSAWLDEHPADDDDPVTPEWLASVIGGGVLEFVSSYYGPDAVAVQAEDCRLGFIRTDKCDGGLKWYACLVDADGFDGSEDYLREVVTRGDARLIARALEIKPL